MTVYAFDREGLLDAFAALGRLAWENGKTVEIAVYGGSALMLSYDWRLATKDVDAVYERDRETVRALARVIAQDRGWPDADHGVKSLYGVSVS